MVQLSVLAAQFEGRPLSKQNISEWRQNGFRDWQMRQSAWEFAEAGQSEPNPSPDGALTKKLAHWVALRYAAAAHDLATTDERPEVELRRLREFCGDIVALRRGDLSAGRLGLEQARLAAEQSQTDDQQEI